MADIFGTMIQNLQSMGFFQYVFPFLLALAVIFGLLEYVFGGKKDERRLPKSATSLISLILSFFVMLYVSANQGIVSFLTNISGYWLVAGSGILFIILLLGLVGVKVEKDFLGKKYGPYILILVIVAIGVVLFFGAGGQALVGVPSWAFSTELWTVIFFVIIMAIVLFMLGSEGEAAPAAGKG